MDIPAKRVLQAHLLRLIIMAISTSAQEAASLFSISKNGDMNWSFYTDGPVRTAPLIDAKGTVYFGSDDMKVYAADANGNELWSLSNRQQRRVFSSGSLRTERFI